MRKITYELKPDLTPELKSKLCKACQWCCRYLVMRAPYMDDNFSQFYHAWGVELKSEGGLLYCIVDAPCQHITDKEGCDIYEKRPGICRSFNGGSLLEREHCLWFNPVLDQPEVK